MGTQKINNLKVIRKNGTNEVWLNGEPLTMYGLTNISVEMPAKGKSNVHLTYCVDDIEIDSDVETDVEAVTEEFWCHGDSISAQINSREIAKNINNSILREKWSSGLSNGI